MPRSPSNASIAASLKPVEGWRPSVPDRLGIVGRDLWNSLVDSKPTGFFVPSDLPTLEEVCRWEEIIRDLDDESVDSALIKALAVARTQQRNALRTLRLTKQATQRRDNNVGKEKARAKPWSRSA